MIAVAAGIKEDLLFLVFFWVENVVAATKQNITNCEIKKLKKNLYISVCNYDNESDFLVSAMKVKITHHSRQNFMVLMAAAAAAQK